MLSSTDIEGIIFVGSIVACLAYFFYCWKTPLSWLNYSRILERARIKAAEVTENSDDVIVLGNVYYCRSRYIESRTSFLAMKMGYKPTDKKIDRLLAALEVKKRRLLGKRRKPALEVDVDILTDMKSQLFEERLAMSNFTLPNQNPNKPRFELSVRLCLSIAVIGSIVDVFMTPFLIVGAVADFTRFQPVATPFVVMCAESVLRRSRDESARRVAHITQIVSVTALSTFFFAALIMVAGVFDFRQFMDYFPTWFR